MISGVSAAASIATSASAPRAGGGTGSLRAETNEVPPTPPAPSTTPNTNGQTATARVSASGFSVLLAAQAGEETNAEGLTPEEQEVVRELQQTDQRVRAHEQAHKSVAGPYAGAISYETTTGPDGREYAIGGSVQIDVSAVPNNPEATIRKMEVVERAALAPADPSPEDFAVARAAQAIRQQAQNELADLREAERNGETEGASTGLLTQLENVDETDTDQNGDAAQSSIAISDAQTILAIINARPGA